MSILRVVDEIDVVQEIDEVESMVSGSLPLTEADNNANQAI
jgi:hypothetical protein